MNGGTIEAEIIRPHPGPQEFMLQQPDDVFEILYGGSRGGGKTMAGLIWLLDYIANPRYRALILRKNNTDLTDWLDRASYIYGGFGGVVSGNPSIVKFPSGAIFRTGYLKDRKSYEKFLGHEYQRIVIEELTQIPDEKYYIQIIGSCRSTVDGLTPQVLCTTNPGGVGHAWVKQRFIDRAVPNRPRVATDTGRKRIYIPATVEDNPTLIEKDPEYITFLDNLKEKDPELWKAWRLGDWNVFAGQMFGEFLTSRHVSSQFGWNLDLCEKIICFDWGYNDPGVAYWLARAPENAQGVRHVYCYREITLEKTTPKDWALLIHKFTKTEQVRYMVLPHDCFSTPHGGQSIADIFSKYAGVTIRRGNTQERGARINRVALTHEALSLASDGRPYVIIDPTCVKLIETLPLLVRDELKVEDVDTDGPDHWWDAFSYGLAALRETRKGSGGVKKPVQIGTVRPIVTPVGVKPAVDIWKAVTRPQKRRRL